MCHRNILHGFLNAPWQCISENPRENTCGSVVFLRLLGASTWYGQGRAPIQKGGYVAARRSEREKIKREGKRGRKRRIYSWRPLHYQFRYGRCIRNSGDDPTTVFGDSPRVSPSLLTGVLLRRPPPLVFSFSLLLQFFHLFLSLFRRVSLIYKAHLTFPWYGLLANNPPMPFRRSHPFFSRERLLLPVSVKPSDEGRSFLRIYTCWTWLAPFRSHPYSFADASTRSFSASIVEDFFNFIHVLLA